MFKPFLPTLKIRLKTVHIQDKQNSVIISIDFRHHVWCVQSQTVRTFESGWSTNGAVQMVD